MSGLYFGVSHRLLAQFESALRSASGGRIKLQLYIAGLNPKSARAIEDLRQLCEEYLPGRCDVEIIDIYQQPEYAVEAQIIAVPTLVKSSPAPQSRVIGRLSESTIVLKHLGLAA